MTNDKIGKNDVDLEDLIAQTEQKIMNNDYYEDVVVEYKNLNVHVRIRPISQARFVALSKNKNAMDNAHFNTLLIHECVLNKHDNKQFTIKQIEELFTGGLATALMFKCAEISGIAFNEEDMNRLKKY